MARTYFNKRNEPDVLEVVIQPAIIAVRGRRLSLRVEASGYRMTHAALLQNKKKIRNGNCCNRPNVFA